MLGGDAVTIVAAYNVACRGLRGIFGGCISESEICGEGEPPAQDDGRHLELHGDLIPSD
jgi:hypothetical protein